MRGTRCILIGALVLGLVVACSSRAEGQERTMRISGDRLSPFVLPIEPVADAVSITALRAEAWRVDDTQRLLLTGDVGIDIGRFSFVADDAAVWINRLPTSDGLVSQVAVFFDRVDNPASRSGQSVAGEQVLVTASTRGEVSLSVSVLDEQRPVRSGLLARGESRLAAYLSRLVDHSPPLSEYPLIEAPIDPEDWTPVPGGDPPREVPPAPGRVETPAVQPPAPWLRSPSGVVQFTARNVNLTPGETEDVITATGGIVVEYQPNDPVDDFSQITLSAQRAVIFASPTAGRDVDLNTLSAEDVRGVYLEGDVFVSANQGEYSVRAPRVYYNFTTGQAIMIDSVLRTYDRQTNIPIVARAGELRQVAENQWEAQEVRVSTSEFAVPHISIGAGDVTVQRRPSAARPEERETFIDSRENVIRLGRWPVIPLPRFRGTLEHYPLVSVQAGTRDNVGMDIETRWDLWALLSQDAPTGVDSELILGGATSRGPIAGLDTQYDVEEGAGELFVWGLYDFGGDDRTAAGREVEIDDGFRGLLLWDHTTELSRNWTFKAQAASISDETLLSSWFEDEYETRSEIETSGYLIEAKDNHALTLLGKWAPGDFVPNGWLLASRGYQVEQLPELGYYRYADKLFDDAITYSSEYRLGRMRMNFEEHTPRELGLRGDLFGAGLDTPISDVLRAAGFTSQFVSRFDTRHELSLPRSYGNLHVTPFVVGRFTAYDMEFEEFSSDSDEMRYFAAAGIRMSTQFHRIDNTVENDLFDLHRMRHIIEPSLLVWYGDTNVEQMDLPVYDEAVESLASGGAVKIGLKNTWQTQRGGPGRWRSVDVFTLENALVFTNDDDQRESPSPQFFDYRPEYSQFGDHLYTGASWALSDTLDFYSVSFYDLDESEFVRGSVGTAMRHSPDFSTYFEYRFIDASETDLFALSFAYTLSPKYLVLIRPQWDLNEDEFRSALLRVTRRFPEFDLILSLRRDEIRDDTTFSASMQLVQY